MKAAIAEISRGGVDPDRVSRRGLRRAVGPVDLPRRGRRDRLYRVRRTEAVRAGARPAGRAPDPRPQRKKQPGKTACSTCGGSTRSSPPARLDTVAADKTHRGHAIIEQVHADLKNSALAHLPSGQFTANAAWLVLAVIAFNLTRAAATLTGHSWPKRPPHRSAASSSAVPARIATSARRLILHLPPLALAEGLDPSLQTRSAGHHGVRDPDHPAAQARTGTSVEPPDSEVRPDNAAQPAKTTSTQPTKINSANRSVDPGSTGMCRSCRWVVRWSGS